MDQNGWERIQKTECCGGRGGGGVTQKDDGGVLNGIVGVSMTRLLRPTIVEIVKAGEVRVRFGSSPLSYKLSTWHCKVEESYKALRGHWSSEGVMS